MLVLFPFLPVVFGAVTGPVEPPKPIDRMSFGELLTAGMDSVNDIAKEQSMHMNPHVVRLREILNGLSKTLPLVNYEESLSGMERQADGFIHDIFHPIETTEDKLRGAYWDAGHLTSDRSSFNLLFGGYTINCVYH